VKQPMGSWAKRRLLSGLWQSHYLTEITSSGKEFREHRIGVERAEQVGAVSISYLGTTLTVCFWDV